MTGALLGAGAKTRVLAVVTQGPQTHAQASSGYTFKDVNDNGLGTTVTGGSGFYTYAWSESDNSAGVWTFLDQGQSGGRLGVSGVPNGDLAAATVKVTVTDSVTGQSVQSAGDIFHFTNTL